MVLKFDKGVFVRPVVSILAVWLSLSAQAQTSSTNEDFPLLKPTREQKIAAVTAVRNLRNHYEQIPLNDVTSEKIYHRYLERLDPNRLYFLKQDIDKFNQYRYKFDNQLKTGNIKPAFEIYNVYQQRIREYLKYKIDFITSDLKKLDFNKSETIEVDREHAPWPKDTQSQQDLWRKFLKDQVLRLKLSGESTAEIGKKLAKRYQNQLHRLNQSNNEDAFSEFLNAFTQIYDPHTQYLSPTKAENFNINMSLSLEGIGALLEQDERYTKVVRLIAKGPAEKAGQLQPADKIVGVGQGKKGEMVDVVGWRLDDVVKLIRGPKKTVVRLEVIPSSETGDKTKTYSIVRDKVKLEEQAAQKQIIELKHNGSPLKVGVIQVPAFYIDFKAAQQGDPNYKSTTRDVKKLISELENEGIDGLVIDLRNNGGGSLQEANELTGLFIPSGPTVLVKNHLGRVTPKVDSDNRVAYKGPMAVLVNRLSASASEIFAGAMQDYQRAIVIGGRTFGKGTVQAIQPINHGELKLTLAKFYRVSGESTQNQGVIPDIQFPALYDVDKVGESSLPDALPWDRIKPGKYATYQEITPYLNQLERSYRVRTKNNPDFIYYADYLRLQKDIQQITVLSLNEKQRKTNNELIDEKRLNIENKRRKAKGEKPYASLEELETKEKNLARSNKQVPVEEDPLLAETGNILADYINIQHRLAATTNN
ncbi:carboxy terminal-processing peptidase [Spartinivicinus poritis]|uniref:Carboxy terminal-processing peptidase n=1 Tax=Spartinivicinus poritis TaxID=2994640 RepID=A0ABT5U7N6_9GAMM|nr:carboxy terminal-processing peptidase [Spartinivicinus sp. A2-2]MDE1462332.1 carboxy terminal-processing peptidase [Spartinivicinus sp. A2-2]